MTLLGPETLAWGYALLLLVLGFVLILLEIFVIPGLNIFGLLGFGTVLIGVWYAYEQLGPHVAAVIAVIGLVGTVVLIRLLIRNRAWQRMILTSETSRAQGYDAAPKGLQGLTGQVGQTLSPLRPSGRALFGELTIDVVTQGGFVESGKDVEVLSVKGNRVIVEERQP